MCTTVAWSFAVMGSWRAVFWISLFPRRYPRSQRWHDLFCGAAHFSSALPVIVEVMLFFCRSWRKVKRFFICRLEVGRMCSFPSIRGFFCCACQGDTLRNMVTAGMIRFFQRRCFRRLKYRRCLLLSAMASKALHAKSMYPVSINGTQGSRPQTLEEAA